MNAAQNADCVLDREGTHCAHWWDQDDENLTACCWCGDDSTEGDDGFSENCPAQFDGTGE